jgi:hypothetical protein
LSAGAFSDPAVIDASKKIMCVFVDCDWGKKNNDLSDKFKVEGYPTVVFCDPEGKEVAQLERRDPAGVAGQITEISKKYGRAGFASFEKAAPVAKDEKKPVLYLFLKPGVASSIGAALADASMKELVEKFVQAQSEITKENADAKALSITDTTLLVLDPGAELKAKPLLKLTGKRDAKEVRKQLEAALKKFEEGGTEK